MSINLLLSSFGDALVELRPFCEGPREARCDRIQAERN